MAQDNYRTQEPNSPEDEQKNSVILANEVSPESEVKIEAGIDPVDSGVAIAPQNDDMP